MNLGCMSEPLSFGGYLVSLPERLLRSATAVAAGLVRELSDVAIPDFLRRTRLYRTLVESTLRFLIEQVAQVPDTYPSGEALAGNFLLRRTAGDGLEFVGMLAFHASPVWVLAALADVSGGGRQLIQEIASTLEREGLLAPGQTFTNVEQLLNGLEQTAGRAAWTLKMPPLDIAELRREWLSLRESVASISSLKLPGIDVLRTQWANLETEAREQNRSVFELSSLLALSAFRAVPQQLLWFGRSALVAAETTGRLVGGALLDHYSQTLAEVHQLGFGRFWAREFAPYLKAAALQFSPDHGSLTERILFNRE